MIDTDDPAFDPDELLAAVDDHRKALKEDPPPPPRVDWIAEEAKNDG